MVKSPVPHAPNRTFRPPPRYATPLIILGLAAFVITSYAGYRGLRAVSEHTAQHKVAFENRLLIQQVLTLLVDMETGQRGFLLTGSEHALEPYERARIEMRTIYPELMARLSKELGDGHRHRREQLDQLIQRRLAIAERNVALRRTRGGAVSFEENGYLDGKPVMDQIRRELYELSQLHSEIIDDRDEHVVLMQANTTVVMFGLTAGGALLILFAIGLLRIERQLRDNAESALREVNGKLEKTIEERTLEVRQALKRIKGFTVELDSNIEAERRRLAREVHDQLGQISTGMKMVVLNIFQAHPDLPKDSLKQLTDLLDQAVVMARRISSELRPPLLDDLGFEAAVLHFSQTTAKPASTQITVDVQDDDVLSPHQANQLFRILQEAMANVFRHAQATEVTIMGRAADGHYALSIADNGVGPQAARPGSSGLRNMQERAAMVDGVLAFGAGKPQGTLVSVQFPLRKEMSP